MIVYIFEISTPDQFSLDSHLSYSACYASMQNWQLALEDALQCVSKDSNFIKGYFRLSIAQSELGMYEDAETTLRAALAKEPGMSHFFC